MSYPCVTPTHSATIRAFLRSEQTPRIAFPFHRYQACGLSEPRLRDYDCVFYRSSVCWIALHCHVRRPAYARFAGFDGVRVCRSAKAESRASSKRLKALCLLDCLLPSFACVSEGSDISLSEPQLRRVAGDDRETSMAHSTRSEAERGCGFSTVLTKTLTAAGTAARSNVTASINQPDRWNRTCLSVFHNRDTFRRHAPAVRKR